MKPILSIIIPVYNTGPYIQRCLDSIYRQNIPANLFEIIIINDGSTDNSDQIISSYCKIQSNIRYFKIRNSGVSAARNLGVYKSSGEMVIFVDSDDELRLGCISQIISLSVSEFDIAIGKSFNQGKEVYKWSDKYSDGEYVNVVDLLNNEYIRGSACGCIFSNSFIKSNSIQFPEGIRNSEDTIFLFKCFAVSKLIVFKDINFYDVIGRTDSASKVFNTLRVKSMINSVRYSNDLIAWSKDTNNFIAINIFGFLKYLLISHLTDAVIYTSKYSYYMLMAEMKNVRLDVSCPLIFIEKKKINILNFSYLLYFILKYILIIKEIFLKFITKKH